MQEAGKPGITCRLVSLQVCLHDVHPPLNRPDMYTVLRPVNPGI